jgi:hypothetical protein
MAFSLGTSAGAGTISIPAGSTVVTGAGTNFQAANVGAILVVGSQWGVIATRTSTTAVTLDRAFATAVTGSAYQISANIPIITQTGTDTSLATLTGVPGVTVSTNIWTITSATLVVNGTLTINRLTNRLRFFNTASVLTASTTQPAMQVGATGVFNNSVTQSLNGYSFKTPSYSILFDVAIPASSNTTAVLIYGLAGSAITLEGDVEYANVLTFNLMFGTLGTMTLQNGGFLNSNANGANYLVFSANPTSTITLNNWSNYGTGLRVGDNVTNINNYASIAGPYAININTGTTLNNVQYFGLQDLGNAESFRALVGLKYLQFVNFASSRATPLLFVSGDAASQFLLVNQLQLNAVASIGNVPDVKFWARDSNNGSRSSANYGAGQAYQIATTGDLTYQTTTVGTGIAPTLNLISIVFYQTSTTTAVTDFRGNNGGLEFNIYQCAYNYNLSNAITSMWALRNGVYGSPSVKTQTFGLLQDTSITQSNMTTVSAYTSLDTAQQLYDFAKFHLYTNFAGQTATYVSRSGNVIGAGSLNFIINQSAANVLTPSGSSIAIKSANFTGSITTSGSVILANGSVVSNNTVTAPNVLQDIPTSLTGVAMTGNLTYNTNTPITITLTDCSIAGTISNTGSAQVNIVKVNTTIGTVGTNVVAQQFATVNAPNLITGTRVRVYDEDNGVEMFNGVLASPGFYQSFVYETDITITLTATYTSGATAKLGLSATGVLTASGVTFLASQEDDTVYNSYGRDGSSATGFAADYVQNDVNLTLVTSFSGANLYAWWVYNTTTEQGIREFFGGITALDVANLRINTGMVSVFLDNGTASFIYQIDAIRIFRSDGVYPARTVTTGGGGIDVNWQDQVYVAPSLDYSALATQASLNLVKAKTDNLPANTAAAIAAIPTTPAPTATAVATAVEAELSAQLDLIQQQASLASALSA